MLKIISAALVAASLLVAPVLSVSADAAQRTGQAPAATTTKTVKLVKHHTRHVVKHHARKKFVSHARHYRAHAAHKRYGKVVRAHRHSHVIVTKKVRAN